MNLLSCVLLTLFSIIVVLYVLSPPRECRVFNHRLINQKLYEGNGEIKTIFDDPKTHESYFEGFKSQLKKWPTNPLDVVIKSLKYSKLSNETVIADFGCGEAKIAKTFPNNKVYSMDILALDSSIIKCNINHTPLDDASVDIGIFCLSLMAKNITEFMMEANRVIKIGGTLKIADVTKRFSSIDFFELQMVELGFKSIKRSHINDMFIFMKFTKEKDVDPKCTSLPDILLLPCFYKNR